MLDHGVKSDLDKRFLFPHNSQVTFIYRAHLTQHALQLRTQVLNSKTHTNKWHDKNFKKAKQKLLY